MWHNPPILIKALLSPKSIEQFSIPDWELCIRQARSSQLLVRLAITLREHSLENSIPRPALKHLVAAVVHYEHLRNAVRNEVAYLSEALKSIDVPLVLLKGAAYELGSLRPARCRLFNDIDLLVPKVRIEVVELSLLLHGWASMQQDAYDERYYRTWMHEIPPLRHLTRLSVVDVHHNIVPDTGSIKVAPDNLLKNIHSCPSNPDVFVLSNQDMILHSAVHLFNDGEFDHGLRDLLDIRDLIHELICTESEWNLLISRAEEIGLVKPLVYALRYLDSLFDEPLQAYLDKLSKHSPSKFQFFVMDFLFLRGLQPDHSSCNDTLTLIARFCLYLRGHALRMPPHLLLPHLMRKSLMRLRESFFPRREANMPLQP